MLVLGSTGHIGQAVVRRALACGHHVTAATRQTDPLALRGLNVEAVRIDEGLIRLPDIAAGHDIIVDAASPYPLGRFPALSQGWRNVVASAVRRTELVLDAARRHRLRLAFISSFTTLPRDESAFQAMESAWRRSVYPYFEAKVAMERAVIAAAREGLPVAVINPAACLGPWEFRDKEMSFVHLVLSRRLPMVMEQVINVIDVRDVAMAIDLALTREYFGSPIPLAGHDITMTALAGRIAALSGVAAPMGIDSRLASAAGFWAETAFAALGRPAPELLRSIPLIADGFRMRPSPEQLAIGLSIRPLDDTLRDAVASHQERGRVE
jgi:dihydroflavonol-4-reductase